MSFINGARPTTDWRDVWISSGAQLISGTGSFLVMTTLLLAFQDGGEGGFAVAGLAIAAALPMVVLAPITGRMADRIDSRLLIVVAGVFQVIAALLLSVAHGVIAQIALLTLLCVGTAIGQPVRAALLPAMASRADLPKASAIGQTASSIGVMIGPALAGFALDGLGVANTLRWASVAYVGTIAAGLLLRTRRGGSAPESSRSSVASSARVTMEPLLRIMIIGLAVVIGAVSAVNVVDVFFVRGTLGASASAYGVISSMWMVGMLAGAWIMARLIRHAKDDGALVSWMFLSLLGTGAAIALMAAAPGAAWLVPLLLLGGSLNGTENVLVTTVLGRRAAPSSRGRISATLQATVQGMGLLGFMAGGLLVELFEPRPIVLGAGLAGIVAVAVVSPWVARAIRTSREPMPPMPQPVPLTREDLVRAA
ncbi:MFS family permease [Allocatelliglobosispora scoriae]|uniref:MFS family permease n=1 Tax=Allocatelliglobosispora scoriae TaxID=643052 RepID=A0A841BV24_9ACTN|nr:MFS transporter [Allocatelliglobosispora scoriae]MBB5870763.1 MFS family permease [Allocatelliglobosispora scoriae]